MFYSFSWAINFQVIHYMLPLKSKFLLTVSHLVGFHLKWLIPCPLFCCICNKLPPFVLLPRHFSTAPSHCLWGLLLKIKDEIKTHVLSEKEQKHWISFIENLKTGRNFIAIRDFWTCTKKQNTPLSHTLF